MIRGVEQDDIVDASGGNEGQYLVLQGTVRIEQRKPIVGADVLQNGIFEKCRFADAGLAEHPNMFRPLCGINRKNLPRDAASFSVNCLKTRSSNVHASRQASHGPASFWRRRSAMRPACIGTGKRRCAVESCL